MITRLIRFIGGLCLSVALCVTHVQSQTGVRYEALTVGATAVGLAAATISPAGSEPNTRCRGRLETAQIRQRWDGTNPTATEGELVEIGDVIDLTGISTLSLVRWIRTGSTSGVLRVHCYR